MHRARPWKLRLKTAGGLPLPQQSGHPSVKPTVAGLSSPTAQTEETFEQFSSHRLAVGSRLEDEFDFEGFNAEGERVPF